MEVISSFWLGMIFLLLCEQVFHAQRESEDLKAFIMRTVGIVQGRERWKIGSPLLSIPAIMST
jgi:hypothetical protein